MCPGCRDSQQCHGRYSLGHSQDVEQRDFLLTSSTSSMPPPFLGLNYKKVSGSQSPWVSRMVRDWGICPVKRGLETFVQSGEDITLRGTNSSVPGSTKCSQEERAWNFTALCHVRMTDTCTVSSNWV